MKQLRSYLAGVLTMLVLFGLAGGALAVSGQKQATLDYTNIKITLDGKEVIPKDANGNTVEPFAIDGTTYLPVRGIANALGLDVGWDGSTSTVVLTTPSSKPGTISFYSDYPDIPDFGVYSGAPCLATFPSETGNTYTYAALSLSNLAQENENIIIDYRNLLVSQGYQISESYESENTILYEKGEISVLIGYTDDSSYFIVKIEESPLDSIQSPPSETDSASLETAVDISKYITQNYRTLETSIGTFTFSVSASTNKRESYPYDYRIELKMDESEYYKLSFAILNTEDEIQTARLQLKEHTRKIAEDLLSKIPDKKITCSYVYSWYEYEYIKVGYHEYKMLTWTNYEPSSTRYSKTDAGEFRWYFDHDLLSWRDT